MEATLVDQLVDPAADSAVFIALLVVATAQELGHRIILYERGHYESSSGKTLGLEVTEQIRNIW